MSESPLETPYEQTFRFIKSEEGIFRVPTVPSNPDGSPIGHSGETIGYGRDLGQNPFNDFERKELRLDQGRTFENEPLTDEEADFLLVRDLNDALDGAMTAFGALEYSRLNTARQTALVSNVFQMGKAGGLEGFPSMMRFMKSGEFEEAAIEVMSGSTRDTPSDFSLQTPKRAKRIADMIRTGEFGTSN